MIIGRYVRVTGRVQGVFYRAWTREQAQQLGVSGWIRNCKNGSVEAHIEGEDAAVRQLIERMRHGPVDAQVSDARIENAKIEDLDGFEVTH